MTEYFTLGEKKFVPQVRQYYRIKHDIEMGPVWRPNLPEVHPFIDKHFTRLTKSWQLRIKEMNPHLTPEKFRAVYGCHLAFANNNGFECRQGHGPFADYINKLDLTSPVPKQESLVCGGNILCGVEVGKYLLVETLNGTDGPPPVEVILSAPWLYFHAITADSRGIPRMFPQGRGFPVLIPLLTSKPVYFPMSKLQKWPLGERLPDPYAFYLPTH